MALPPISIKVRLEEQVPFGERKIALVRLSTQALIAPDCGAIDAVAIEPAITAPERKAATMAAERDLVIFIALIITVFPYILLCIAK
jgi:hypothetical protein